MPAFYETVDDLLKVFRCFRWKGLLLPRGQLPLNIFEPRYLTMLEHTGRGRVLGIIQPGDELQKAARPQLVGCVGRITSFSEKRTGA